MSKHTPGPWKAVYVGCSDWDLSGPVTEQDWKLAAAAPDLLEALQSLLGMPDYDGTAETSRLRLNHKHAAWAAIAKATGETN